MSTYLSNGKLGVILSDGSIEQISCKIINWNSDGTINYINNGVLYNNSCNKFICYVKEPHRVECFYCGDKNIFIYDGEIVNVSLDITTSIDNSYSMHKYTHGYIVNFNYCSINVYQTNNGVLQTFPYKFDRCKYILDVEFVREEQKIYIEYIDNCDKLVSFMLDIYSREKDYCTNVCEQDIHLALAIFMSCNVVTTPNAKYLIISKFDNIKFNKLIYSHHLIGFSGRYIISFSDGSYYASTDEMLVKIASIPLPNMTNLS